MKIVRSLIAAASLLCGGAILISGNSFSNSKDPFIAGNNARIAAQSKKKREFSKNEIQLKDTIIFESLADPVFRPTFLLMDEPGNIYTLDYANYKIHKFSPAKALPYRHLVFGKGMGQGPGEFSRVEDMKIFKDRLYVAGQSGPSLDVYATDGTFLERMRIDAGQIPRKLVITRQGIVIQPSYSGGHLFHLCDFSGKALKSFGEYIDPSEPNNIVYHDNTLTDYFGENGFFDLPIYLGYIAIYDGGEFRLAKYTIDGPDKKPKAIRKKVAKDTYAITVDREYMTATCGMIFGDYILIKANDLKNKIAYWDIYTVKDFDYVLSVKNPPALRYFAIKGDQLVGVNDEEMKFFDIRNVREELESKRREASVNKHPDSDPRP